MSNRVAQNEQKLQFLQENHGESVRYLREYRENFRRIASEYQQSVTNSSNNAGNGNNVSGDQISVNQSQYGGGGGQAANSMVLQK